MVVATPRPEAPVTPPAYELVAPPAPPDTPPSRPPSVPPSRQRGGVGGLILIAIGLVALFGTSFPGRGAWIFLGLGAAFLIARVLTDRRGYAVPAGILLGFGSFVLFTETGMLDGPAAGGTFFIFLGL